MKKLKLNLDDLKIESFETTPELTGRGTINGHASASCGCTNTDITQECTEACDPPVPSKDTCTNCTCLIEYCF